MAKNTQKTLRNQVIYSVFVRNYSQEGTFKALEADLDRIKDLGVDIIWMLPIHPIGEAERKGSLGSPYAIRNYREINPEYGTLDDFKDLVSAIHKHGMKCMIDVVYNHTSPDSWLAQHHPEWFFKKADGSFGNKVGEWLDVIDLDYSHKELWNYQIETLKYWAEIVDGFRCDVAPLIPLDFWLQARQEVAAVNPHCLWLSESVEPVFTVENRARGMVSLSDSEIFQAFDISYEYDVFHYFKDFLEGKLQLSSYTKHINMQEAIYPDNYVKMRFLENHDTLRAGFMIPNETVLRNLTAFLYFQKGTTLIYAGQEVQETHRPSLFDKDTLQWDFGKDISQLLATLSSIKKDSVFSDSRYEVQVCPKDVLYATHCNGKNTMTGIFSTTGEQTLLSVSLQDGCYKNLIDSSEIEVHMGKISYKGEPIIIKT